MYHYVRPAPDDMPYFRYLHVADFCAQLDALARDTRFLSKAEFFAALDDGQPRDGLLLTFDDGFAEHYTHVLPALLERGLWGVFYVPTGMYTSGKLLDVHRVHTLLGRHGGATILDALTQVVTDDMLSPTNVDAFRADTYSRQDNDDDTRQVKRTLNYYLAAEHKTPVLDALMQRFIPDEAALVRSLYLSRDQICGLRDAGMLVGSHSARHPVMSTLGLDDQAQEIDASFAYLEDVLQTPIQTFCYPYGGPASYTEATERLLAERGCKFSFAVDPRDIDASDLADRPQALPRYDCNLFPHGQASLGAGPTRR